MFYRGSDQQNSVLLLGHSSKSQKRWTWSSLIACVFLASIVLYYSLNLINFAWNGKIQQTGQEMQYGLYTFQSAEFEGQFWRIKNPKSQKDNGFLIYLVPGFAGQETVSFRLQKDKQMYLHRERDGELEFVEIEDQISPLWEKEASFVVGNGRVSGSVTFESVSNPGDYIIISNNQLITEQIQSDNMLSASWLPRYFPTEDTTMNQLSVKPSSLLMLDLTISIGDTDNPFSVQLGSIIRLTPYAYPSSRMMHEELDVFTKTDDGSEAFMNVSTFVAVGGLAKGGSFSLQVQDMPGYYLSHDSKKNVIIEALQPGGEQRASWYVEAGSFSEHVRLQSVDLKDYYMRVKGAEQEVIIEKGKLTDIVFKYDSNWLPELIATPGVQPIVLVPESTIRFGSFAYEDNYIALNEGTESVSVQKSDESPGFVDISLFVVKQSLVGEEYAMSFSLRSQPESYLKVADGVLVVGPVVLGEEGAASWYLLSGTYLGYYKLLSYALTNSYIRSSGDIVLVEADDQTIQFDVDSNWEIQQYSPPEPPPVYVSLQAGSLLQFNSLDLATSYLALADNQIELIDDDGSSLFLQLSSFYTRPGLQGENTISFESFAYPDWYIYHQDGLVYVGSVDPAAELSASWYVREGDTENFYQIESAADANSIIIHEKANVYLREDDGSYGESGEWTFSYIILAPPQEIYLPNGEHVRFESYNEPNNYLSVENFSIRVNEDPETTSFLQESLFRVVQPGLSFGDSYSFEAILYPGYYLTKQDDDLVIAKVAFGDEAFSSWNLVDSSIAGFYQLESVAFADNFITYEVSKAKVLASDGSNTFTAKSNWNIEVVISEEAQEEPALLIDSHFQFRSYLHPDSYLRHEGGLVWRRKDDGTDLFESDSTFIVHEGMEGLGSYSFESYNQLGYYLYYSEEGSVTISRVSSGSEKFASWYVRGGIDFFVQLEAFSLAGSFLYDDNAEATLRRSDGSQAFNELTYFFLAETALPAYLAQLSLGLMVRLESTYKEGWFVRQQNFEVWGQEDDASLVFQVDSTFLIVEGLAGSSSLSFECVGKPGYYLSLQGKQVVVVQVTVGSEEKASWFERDSSGDTFKLESFYLPGYFLSGNSRQIKVIANDGTGVFDEYTDWLAEYVTLSDDVIQQADSTWTVVVGQRYAFETADRQDLFWSHLEMKGLVIPSSNDTITDVHYQFDVVEGLAGEGTVSFRSVSNVDLYFYNNNQTLAMGSPDGSGEFLNNASFFLRNGLSADGSISFEALALPGFYIKHDSSFFLVVEEFTGKAGFNEEASFFAHSVSSPAAASMPTYFVPYGETVRLALTFQPDMYLSHNGFEVSVKFMSEDEEGDDVQESMFVVEQGLAGGEETVSFRAVSHPTSFIFREGTLLYVGLISAGTEAKATFWPQESPLGYYALFEAFDFSGYYISNDQGSASLVQYDSSSQFTNSSTWSVILQALSSVPSSSVLNIGEIYSFQSSTTSGYYWNVKDYALWLDHLSEGSNVWDTPSMQFQVLAGQDGVGTVSFRSAQYPTRFLRHSNDLLWLHIGLGQEFAEEASFYAREGLGGRGGLSFEAINLPNHYIRVDGHRIVLSQLDCCEGFRDDATFLVVQVEEAQKQAEPSEVFEAQILSDMHVHVSNEILARKTVINTDNGIMLQIIDFNETRNNAEIFQQLGGNYMPYGESVPLKIALPDYDFERGSVTFGEVEEIEVVFNVGHATPITFIEEEVGYFQPLGMYEVNLVVSKATIEANFIASNDFDQRIEGNFILQKFALPQIQVMQVGTAVEVTKFETVGVFAGGQCDNCD